MPASQGCLIATHRVGDAMDLAGTDGGASIERDLFLTRKPVRRGTTDRERVSSCVWWATLDSNQ